MNITYQIKEFAFYYSTVSDESIHSIVCLHVIIQKNAEHFTLTVELYGFRFEQRMYFRTGMNCIKHR